MRLRLLGKGGPGQAVALHCGGLRFAPTPLRCSGLRPVEKLAPRPAAAALKQSRRVRGGGALRALAASPALLAAPEARHGLPGPAFATTGCGMRAFHSVHRHCLRSVRRCLAGAISGALRSAVSGAARFSALPHL